MVVMMMTMTLHGLFMLVAFFISPKYACDCVLLSNDTYDAAHFFFSCFCFFCVRAAVGPTAAAGRLRVICASVSAGLLVVGTVGSTYRSNSSPSFKAFVFCMIVTFTPWIACSAPALVVSWHAIVVCCIFAKLLSSTRLTSQYGQRCYHTTAS